MDAETLIFEAALTPATAQGGFEGREWEITIIGPKLDEAGNIADGYLLTVEGREYIRSTNGRLYAVDRLRESVGVWDGVKVYDNHLTQEEFERRQGMRSTVKEWIGTIVNPSWQEAKRQVRGIYKVVDEDVAAKLKHAYEQDVLGSIGFSIDTFPIMGREIAIEGQRMPVIEGFKKILSVDQVAEPAAGGRFERLIAAEQISQEANANMNQDEIKQLVADIVAEILPAAVSENVKSALAEALAAEAEEEDGAPEADAADTSEQDAPAQPEPDTATQEAIRRLECKLTLRDALDDAGLTGKFRQGVEQMFAGQIFEEAGLAAVIKTMKEAQAAADPTGRVTESGGGQPGQQRSITAGLDESDYLEVAFMRKAMGTSKFNRLEGVRGDEASTENPLVTPRLTESYQDWLKAGKPTLGRHLRMSELVRAMLGGKHPLLDEIRATEASTLATVIKNTVNIMIAADYSLQQRWYEDIVTVEEVDSIDDTTLARLYGVSTLSVVEKRAPYTELVQDDEEETASFVKKGNYVSVPLEDLMRDKLSYFQTLPRRLADTWYNTLSALTAAVFTTNSAAGPVLSDTGALFNATAVGTAGGHANLLTAALSWTSYGAARTAMRKQTNQPLGAGRKAQINPAFVLAPEDLETTALQIRNTELKPGTANNDINPYFQKFEVICVPDWTDTDNWALVADKTMFPAIYHIFPRGGNTPQLFTADNPAAGTMFTNDTIRYKVRLMTYRFSSTYDCAPVADFRPLHKNNV